MNREEISLSFEINEENKKVIDFLREEAKNQYWFTIENEHGERLDIVEKEKYDLLQQENQELKKQLEYLRSGEYYNQLRFERDMLQDLVDKKEISKEDKEFIDMTHRNTELLEQQQEFIEYLESYLKLFDNKDTSEEGYYDCIEEILSKYKEITGQVDSQV